MLCYFVTLREQVSEEELAREEAEKETDVLKKQALLVRCRKEQAALQAASSNISDVGKKLDYNPKKMEVTNSPEANRLLRKEYR